MAATHTERQVPEEEVISQRPCFHGYKSQQGPVAERFSTCLLHTWALRIFLATFGYLLFLTWQYPALPGRRTLPASSGPQTVENSPETPSASSTLKQITAVQEAASSLSKNIRTSVKEGETMITTHFRGFI